MDVKPSEIVGTGRSADVYALADGTVLRRYRSPRNTELEVAAMEYARSRGFPAPAASALSETDISMERVSGPTMLTDLTRRPWLISRHAATLAALHHQLRSIPGPNWLPPAPSDGDALLHLDLHPDNVILSSRGPVVIDWPNAARGAPDLDIAHTWLVLACSVPVTGLLRQAISRGGRRAFLDFFLGHFERSTVAPELGSAATLRRARPDLPERERAAIERVLERHAVP